MTMAGSAYTFLLLVILQFCIYQAAGTSAQCMEYTHLTLSPSDVCNCTASRNGDGGACRSLSNVLLSFSAQIQSGNCLNLSLDPGVYTFSCSPTVLNYSAVITAPEGGVTFTCQTECAESVDNGNITHLVFRKSKNELGNVSVTLETLDFRDCAWPLQFDDLDYVTISGSTFSDFSSSAVDIYNCWEVSVEISMFFNNTATEGTGQYRANSGGLSIAYHSDEMRSGYPLVRITESTFWSNRALLPTQNSSQQINLALNDHYYFGRGGGLGIFIDESYANVSTEIDNCTFVENYAKSFGGGLYLYVDGNETHHDFTVSNCNFTSNEAGEGSFGGGLQVALLIRNLNSLPSTCNFTKCFFGNNSADFGGGLSTVQVYSLGAGNSVSLSESKFVNNTANDVGSAVMFASLLYVQSRNESRHYRVSDCNFTRNSASGGTLGAGFIHVDFSGTNIFSENVGPGLRIVGSLIGVRDTLNFTANDATNTEGGALYISAFGQVKLYEGSEINFIGNRGRIGSAIVVVVQRSSVVFSELIYNPQCFLLHENTTLAPNEWNNVTVRFHGNEARVGPAVYISHLSLCSWYSVTKISNVTNRVTATFSVANFTIWPVFNYDDSNRALAQKDNSSSHFYFQTEAVEMISTNNNSQPIPIRPGQTANLNLMGLDQLNHSTYVIVRFSDSRSNINLGAFSQAGDTPTGNVNDVDVVRLDPGLIPLQPSDDMVNISYGFPDLRDRDHFPVGEVISITADTPYNIISSEPFSFLMEFADCQPGYVLRRPVEGDNIFTCSCEDSDFDVLTCDEDDEVIVLRDGLWAGPDVDPEPHLDVYPCPVPYCSCQFRDSQTCETLYFQNDPNKDRQCHATRKGTLCGECVNGTGVGVLRGNCRDCSRNSYYALGFLIIADIILSGVILFSSVSLHFHFPHSLKGLLFYIQTVYYVTEYFPSSFWDIRQYMLYLGSILGLYFPWDFCLSPRMQPLDTFGPRFIPPITSAVVVGGTLIAVFFWFGKQRRHSFTHKARKRIWHGVWTLVLLLYAPLAYTCSALIHCPSIPGNGQDEEYRWFLDGGVECFRDPLHITLGIVAILVLIFLSLLIPAVFLFTLIGKSPRVQRYAIAERLYEALVEGYHEGVRWWGAWDLLRRLLLIIIIVALPGRTVASLYIVIPALTIHLFFLPYEKWWHNLIEAAVLLNYIFLLLLRSTQTFLDSLESYSGTSIPAERGKGLARENDLTWLLFPFYYLPAFAGIAYCLGRAVYWIGRWYKGHHAKMISQSPSAIPLGVSDTGGRYEEFDSIPSTGRGTAVTTTVVGVYPY